METAYVREEIAAPVTAVWPLIRNFGDISAWAMGARVVKLEGAGVGAIRHVEGKSGHVVERCEAHDEAGHSFSYSLLESPWPFASYVAEVRLEELDSNRCSIEWCGKFDSTAAAPPNLRQLVESSYRDGFIALLKQSVEMPQPRPS